MTITPNLYTHPVFINISTTWPDDGQSEQRICQQNANKTVNTGCVYGTLRPI